MHRSILLGLALAASVAPRAYAYKCTPVPNANLTQAWNQRCIPYFISREGVMLSGEERKLMVDQGFRVWTDNACTDLDLKFAGYTGDSPGFDASKPSSNKNIIASIEDPAKATLFPDPRLLAVTLTSFSVETGEIFDADILLNGTTSFAFDDVTDVGVCMAASNRPYDLRNTLIHEMGHFIGFDHDTARESTMFASAEQCETKKRDLTDDDRLGLCTVYPADQPTATCKAPADYDNSQGDPSEFRRQCELIFDPNTGSCGCSAGGQPEQMLGFVALAALMLARKWRGA